MSTSQSSAGAPSAPAKIGPDDPRYRAVVDRQFNKRFRANPDYVRIVTSAEQVASVLEEAVGEGRRVVVTSGGHCLEGFVTDPGVRAIIDVAPMKGIYYDAKMRAIAVEAGATVGETFRALFDSWGTVIPLGEYPGIGMGGHVVGGAFGFLCREYGLAADYLYAVEVVTVNENGRAQIVVATREQSDPNRELWWAHTGGGGGNFGIVTRYWFRSQNASGDDPSTLLPRAPQSVTTFKTEWSWSDLDRASFLRLLQNHGRWSEQNAGADSPYASIMTLLEIHTKAFGKVFLRGASTAGANADKHWDAHVAAITEGTQASTGRDVVRLSWLDFALDPWPELFTMPPGGAAAKVKDALLKKRFTDKQIGIAYDYLTRDDDFMSGVLGLATYGGKVNTVATDATASSQRSAILDTACNAGWLEEKDAERNLKWVRALYHELVSDTGGVPVPGGAYEGSLINHPDADLADPAYNKSGVPWSTIYYKDNYPRLQRVKTKWDPRDVFTHALSIRPS